MGTTVALPQRCLTGDSFCSVSDSIDVGILLPQKSGAHARSWQVVKSFCITEHNTSELQARR
jgi:hypothetical protein